MKTLLLSLTSMLSFISFTTSQNNATDSLAMVDFYNALDGHNWNDNANWLSSAPISQWKGLSFSNGRLVSIDMKNNNCKGNIGPSLSNCTELSDLFLLENQIEGIAELDSFHQMKRINLSTNKLQEFPSFILKCVNLERLNLYDNAITGSIPAEINNLQHITELTLSQNKFEGTVETMEALRDLTVIDFSINYNLEGNLADILYGSLDLRILDISKSKISGALKPTYFDENANLRIFADSSAISSINQIQNFNISKIWMRDTDLGFDQLRSIIDQNVIGQYLFNPQNEILGTEPIEASVGDNVTIPCFVEGAQSIQWYKNNFFLPDETSDELTINNIQMATAGEYNCSGSHDDLPLLFIHQEPTVVNVGTISTIAVDASNFKIFPNPASEYIQLIGEELFNTQYSIYNQAGQLTTYGTFVNNRIDIQSLNSGNYILMVEVDGKTTVKKSFIKI